VTSVAIVSLLVGCKWRSASDGLAKMIGRAERSHPTYHKMAFVICAKKGIGCSGQYLAAAAAWHRM
jgi:hypothetical protein